MPRRKRSAVALFGYSDYLQRKQAITRDRFVILAEIGWEGGARYTPRRFRVPCPMSRLRSWGTGGASLGECCPVGPERLRGGCVDSSPDEYFGLTAESPDSSPERRLSGGMLLFAGGIYPADGATRSPRSTSGGSRSIDVDSPVGPSIGSSPAARLRLGGCGSDRIAISRRKQLNYYRWKRELFLYS